MSASNSYERLNAALIRLWAVELVRAAGIRLAAVHAIDIIVGPPLVASHRAFRVMISGEPVACVDLVEISPEPEPLRRFRGD